MDRKTIVASLPNIQTSYKKKGFAEDEISNAVTYAWMEFRLGPKSLPNSEALSQKKLEQQAQQQGRLVVTSEPDQATIQVDDDWVWQKRTNTVGYPNAGRRHVKVTLSGYDPAEADCNVETEGVSRFSAKLRADKSTAICK